MCLEFTMFHFPEWPSCLSDSAVAMKIALRSAHQLQHGSVWLTTLQCSGICKLKHELLTIFQPHSSEFTAEV